MRRFNILALLLLTGVGLALGLFEITAKGPDLCDLRLPGWQAGRRAEMMTAWSPRTGCRPVDRLLHESEEAVRFYTYLLDDRRQPAAPRAPAGPAMSAGGAGRSATSLMPRPALFQVP